MSTKQQELLASHTNVDDANADNSLSSEIYREQVPNTPFYIVGKKEDDHSYFITLAQYRLTQAQTLDDCIDQIHEKPWTLIGVFVSTLIELHNEKSTTKI